MKKDSDISEYYLEIQRFVAWYDENHQVLNVKKTEEMVFDPEGVGDHRPVVIHDGTISQVSSYKYLGVFIDSFLTWNTHVDGLCSRLQQRLHSVDQMLVYRYGSLLSGGLWEPI